MKSLALWLQENSIDQMPLECDGLTRVISTLMSRDGIAHSVKIGSLDVDGVGTIPLHWWIELADGFVCDYRAQMWLGHSDAVPHGIVAPDALHHYDVSSTQHPEDVALHPVIFAILAERDITLFSPYVEEPELDYEVGGL